MTSLTRRIFLMSCLATPVAGCLSGNRWESELSAYKVRDPLAGYFDLAERRAIMRTTTNPVLVKLRERLQRGPNCDEVRAIPIQDQRITLPSFYGDNAAWRLAVAPFRDFEDAVSGLAAANLVAGDRRYADCLITLLMDWARRNGLAKFNYSGQEKQGWFQVESTLFAIGHALAAIRPDVQHREKELRFIDAWLLRIAGSHFSIPGEPDGTCCNNHYYRRALYATIIGVIIADDDLFRSGIGAVYSALSEATPEGALPLEMARGDLAAHYQNYAVMYLAMIAEIAERQGIPLWSLQIDGKTLHTLVVLNNRIIADPDFVTRYSGTREVSLRYRKDKQYFAWFEMYLARFRNAEMEAWIADRRPLYNRSLGGHMTAYFYSGPQGRLEPAPRSSSDTPDAPRNRVPSGSVRTPAFPPA